MSKTAQPTSAHDNAGFIQIVEDGIVAADAGQLIDYEAVRPWLLSWGTEAEGPPPPCG